MKPGEWTTDVEGVKEAASRDGRLIAVLCANRKGCGWTQRFMPIAESAEFLSWAEANGVYLLTADSSQLVDTEAADDYFWDLYPRGQSASYPTLVFADPKSPNVRLSWGVARNNQSSTIGGVLYKDTVESLARGIAAVMGETFVPVAPTVSPNTELINIFPLTVSLTNTNSSGVIYYTLDGSSLTSENSKQYTGPIIIQNNEAVLCAAVKTASGLFGIPLVQRFKLTSDYVNNCLQTQEIFWMVTGSVGWQESTYEGKPALRTGGYLGNEPYVSTLEAKINGKGKFRFSYKFCNWNKDNTMQFRVNDDVKKNVTWYVGTNYVIETVELEIDGETTLAWTYSVSQPNSDYSNSYSSNGKSAWCGLWLFDVNWMPETISTTTTPVEVPHLWIAEKFPTATPSTYEMLMNDDSDGDGFLNWQEYLCGTDPNSAGTNADSVPHCTIKIVNGLPQVGNNIEIPTAAKTAGWRATTKGSTNLNDWFDADASVHTFFRVVVEQQK